jgi:hypothetical protein
MTRLDSWCSTIKKSQQTLLINKGKKKRRNTCNVGLQMVYLKFQPAAQFSLLGQNVCVTQCYRFGLKVEDKKGWHSLLRKVGIWWQNCVPG